MGAGARAARLVKVRPETTQCVFRASEISCYKAMKKKKCREESGKYLQRWIRVSPLYLHPRRGPLRGGGGGTAGHAPFPMMQTTTVPSSSPLGFDVPGSIQFCFGFFFFFSFLRGWVNLSWKKTKQKKTVSMKTVNWRCSKGFGVWTKCSNTLT